MKHKSLQNIVFASIFSAIIAVMAQIVIPLPSGVPLTLQTFAVCLCGFFLGSGWGTAAVAVYIAVGAVGLPVFSAFSGGFQVLFGATGGFIIGFLPLVFLCGLSKKTSNKPAKVALCLSGLILCHIIGVLQFAVLYKISFFAAALSVSLPFILKDILFAFAAYIIAEIINKRLKNKKI